ncbi:hypothetical protein Q5P01_024143 [Channa striata]|uniref:phospholipase A2 n=1 Tax=Channa striata TaxID=64152 RepID=A0AA88IQG9_CHASR|nr:hypothetical protein Q5P01_024143 [Channa striata]
MTHTAPLLAVVLTASLLRWTAAEAAIFCSWTKVLPGGDVHVAFVRQGSSSLRLYHSVWSGGQRVLLGCSWSDDAALIHSYVSRCRERAQDFSDLPDGSVDLRPMLEDEVRCLPVEERTGQRLTRSVADPPAPGTGGGRDGSSEVRGHQRVKRGFIVPGTLWCGSGNKAPSYEDLGVFEDTDSCCREHDQCKHTILSFHSNFGVFNSNIFTMSHCDCDNKFRSCLMEASDSISSVVGYTFFNLLKMHCFEFAHRLQCTQRNWFGMCKETKMALYAEVHPPTLYETTSPTEVSMNSTGSVIINATTPTELRGSTVSDPRLFSVTSAAPTASAPAATSPSVAAVTASTVSDTPRRPTGSAAEVTDQQENTLPAKTQTPAQLDADITEPVTSATDRRLSCGIFKELDECKDKILPLRNRHGLHNPEPRTLYHCNCTARLFQTSAAQRPRTDIHALLLGHVSQSCFLLQDCTADRLCTAVLVKAELPGLDVDEQHHLQAVKLKVRRPSSSRAKRKDGAVRLHKLCLRLSRTQSNKSRKQRQNGRQEAVRRPELV